MYEAQLRRWIEQVRQGQMRRRGLRCGRRRQLGDVKRTALFLRMNDLLMQHIVVVPVMHRKTVAALSTRLQAPISAWASDLWRVHDWYRSA